MGKDRNTVALGLRLPQAMSGLNPWGLTDMVSVTVLVSQKDTNTEMCGMNSKATEC